MLGGVEPQRHDQCIRPVIRNARKPGPDRRVESAVAFAMRQRQVEIMAFSCASTGLVGVTGIIGEVIRRIGMDRDGEDIRALIEDPLGTVAGVMDVDVEDRDAGAIALLRLEPPRGEGGGGGLPELFR